MASNSGSSAQLQTARAANAARRVEIVKMIRESDGLTSDEKVFLYNLATHEDLREYSKRDRVRSRLGMSDAAYRVVPQQLVDRGLIKMTRRAPRSTIYELRVSALRRYYDKNQCVDENDTVDSVNAPSRDRQGNRGGGYRANRVDRRQQKENPKRNQEKINKNKKGERGRTVWVSKKVIRRALESADDEDLDL